MVTSLSPDLFDSKFQARLVRRQVRRLAQMARYRRLSLSGVPVIFANSFPKSGTHLLTQVLHSLAQVGPAVDSGLPAVVTYEGDTGRARSTAQILADLQRFLPGDIGYGHLHALPIVRDYLCSPGFAPFFILRDPRDVVVSHVHYVTDMQTNHIHHRYYTEELHSFDERLMTSILGRPEWGADFPDVRRRFEPYLGWLNRPAVLALHYEDFMDNSHGHGPQPRQVTLGRVLDHVVRRGFPLTRTRAQAIQILSDGIDPQRSPTFRQGKTGGWVQHFTPEHKAVFKQVTGDLLVRLGYESDDSW